MVTYTEECARVCPVSSFQRDFYCMPCHGTCLQSAGCTGSSDRDCTRCATAKYMYIKMYTYVNFYMCVSKCSISKKIATDQLLCKCLVEFCPSEHDVIVYNECTPGPFQISISLPEGNSSVCGSVS